VVAVFDRRLPFLKTDISAFLKIRWFFGGDRLANGGGLVCEERVRALVAYGFVGSWPRMPCDASGGCNSQLPVASGANKSNGMSTYERVVGNMRGLMG